MTSYAGDATPAGMQPGNYSDYLVYHDGHAHIDEANQPVVHGENKPNHADGPLAFKEWTDRRAELNSTAGSPLPPGGATP